MSVTNNTTVPQSSATPGITTSSVIQAVYLIIVITVSVIANLIIITAILKKRLLRHVINFFILNLAIADLLNACLKMSTTVAGTFDREWYGSHIVCYFTTPFGVLFGAASVINLTAVALNRYLVISAPLNYERIMPTTQAKLIIMCVWLGSIGLAIPPITWREGKTICRSGAVDPRFYKSELVYFCCLWIFVIVLPLIIMTTTYALIYRIARRQMHLIEQLDVERRQNDDAKKRRRKREIKTAAILAVVGGAFIICWLPFFIIQTLYKFGNQKINPDYFKVFLCWMYSNSAINPILLIVFNQEIRHAVRRLICRSSQVSPEMTEFTVTQ